MDTKKDELFSTIRNYVGENDSARETHAKLKASHKEAMRHAINQAEKELLDEMKAEIEEMNKSLVDADDAKKKEICDKIEAIQKQLSDWDGFRVESGKLQRLKSTNVPDSGKEAHLAKIKKIAKNPFFEKILSVAKAKLAETDDEKEFRRHQTAYLKNMDACREDIAKVINEICSLRGRFEDEEYRWLLNVAGRNSISNRRIRQHMKWAK